MKLDTGSLVRDPILTSGFYWYDAPVKQAPGFQQWLRDNASLVKVRKSTSSLDDVETAHIWTLFEVIFPVLWLDAKEYGFPNTASADTGPDVASSGAEPSKNPIDVIADSVKDAVPLLAPVSSGVLVVAGLAGLAYFFRKEIFSYGVQRLRSSRGSRSRRAKS